MGLIKIFKDPQSLQRGIEFLQSHIILACTALSGELITHQIPAPEDPMSHAWEGPEAVWDSHLLGSPQDLRQVADVHTWTNTIVTKGSAV